MKIKQGYLYMANYTPSLNTVGKYRPSLVIQNNRIIGSTNTVITVPLTSNPRKIADYHIPIESSHLKKKSYFLVNAITTLHKDRVRNELGKITKDKYEEVIDTLNILISGDRL